MEISKKQLVLDAVHKTLNDKLVQQVIVQIIQEDEAHLYTELLGRKYFIKERLGNEWRNVLFLYRNPRLYIPVKSTEIVTVYKLFVSFFPYEASSYSQNYEQRINLAQALYFVFIYFFVGRRFKICKADYQILRDRLDKGDILLLSVERIFKVTGYRLPFYL